MFVSGGNVNAVDKEFATPLHLAVRPPNPIEMDLVTLLIKAGARSDAADGSGRRPIDCLPKPQVNPYISSAYETHVCIITRF